MRHNLGRAIGPVLFVIGAVVVEWIGGRVQVVIVSNSASSAGS